MSNHPMPPNLETVFRDKARELARVTYDLMNNSLETPMRRQSQIETFALHLMVFSYDEGFEAGDYNRLAQDGCEP